MTASHRSPGQDQELSAANLPCWNVGNSLKCFCGNQKRSSPHGGYSSWDILRRLSHRPAVARRRCACSLVSSTGSSVLKMNCLLKRFLAKTRITNKSEQWLVPSCTSKPVVQTNICMVRVWLLACSNLTSFHSQRKHGSMIGTNCHPFCQKSNWFIVTELLTSCKYKDVVYKGDSVIAKQLRWTFSHVAKSILDECGHVMGGIRWVSLRHHIIGPGFFLRSKAPIHWSALREN